MERFLYEPYTGRLEETEKTDPRAQNPTWGGTDAAVFDRSGNKRRFTDNRTVSYGGLTNGQGTLKDWTEYYYGADDKLRVFDRRACVYGLSNPGGVSACWDPAYANRPTFEEYRYDALGRRVMTRTDQTWACTAHCVTAETRTVWDGDQVIAEIRSPWGSQQDTGPMEEAETSHPRQMGRVLYTHGLGLDKPLLLARIDYDSFYPGTNAIVPHTNWLGNYDSGTFVAQQNATGPACMTRPRVQQDIHKYPFEDPDVTGGLNQDSITICYSVEWPAPYLWNSKRPIDRGKWGPPSWMGSLVEGGRDPSGQMYMRNRYYDPNTGRFTQEDPIGLAGGINLYGFAGGDAVNFDDPYGLFKIEYGDDKARLQITKLREVSPLIARDLIAMKAHEDIYILERAAVLGGPGMTWGPATDASGRMVRRVQMDPNWVRRYSLAPSVQAGGGISEMNVWAHEIHAHAGPSARGQSCSDEGHGLETCGLRKENKWRAEQGWPDRTYPGAPDAPSGPLPATNKTLPAVKT